MRNKIIYFASSRGIGFTQHISDFSIVRSSELDFIFLSGEKEQFPGVFKKIDAHNVNRRVIYSLDDNKKFIKHAFCLKKLIVELTPKIVHTQTNYQLFITALLKPFFDFKIIHTINAFNNGVGGYKKYITKSYNTIMCCVFVDKVLFQSTYVEDNFPLLKKKSIRIPMGFEKNNYKVYGRLDHKTIIYAAKYHKAKNHKWLVNTLSNFLKENDWKLVLPGNGEEFESTHDLVNSLGLASKVIMPGWIDRVAIDDLYKKSTLAIIPSQSETLGHNIIEPLAYGIPVISFPVGVAPDIAKNSAAVTCINYYDASGLVETISKIVSSADSYNKKAEQSLSFFKLNFTWKIYLKKYEKLINEL